MPNYPILSDWYCVLNNAQRVFLNRDGFAYLYGGNGEYIRTKDEATAIVNKMWGLYASHFQASVIKTGHSKDELIEHIVGKRVLDCSALVCYVSQATDWTKLKVTYDLNSSGLITASHDITTPKDGIVGGVLWKSGHVGIDVGGDGFVEAANEFVDIRMRKISEAGFTKSGRLPWVAYGKYVCATNR